MSQACSYCNYPLTVKCTQSGIGYCTVEFTLPKCKKEHLARGYKKERIFKLQIVRDVNNRGNVY